MCYALGALNLFPAINDILVVVPEGYELAAKKIIDQYHFDKTSAVIVGGTSRTESVYNALLHLKKEGEKDEAIVLIQDGDRPRISEDLIKRNILAAETYGAAVTAIPATDSVFLSEDGEQVEHYVPRKKVFLAQTPQTFRFGLIYEAHEKAHKNKDASFTDDASVVLSLSLPVHVVAGSANNVKITTKNDAERFLREEKK